jgi:hypothetical protein
MKKNNSLIAVILSAIFLLGCSLLLTTKIITRTNSKLLLNKCCASGEKWCKPALNNDYKICPDNYEEKCKKLGGYLNTAGNLGTGIKTFSCYKSDPNVGKFCSNDDECQYNCDLNNGIIKNLCILKKIEESENDTTEIYECLTDKPGICSPIPIDLEFERGGYKFIINGKNLKRIHIATKKLLS